MGPRCHRTSRVGLVPVTCDTLRDLKLCCRVLTFSKINCQVVHGFDRSSWVCEHFDEPYAADCDDARHGGPQLLESTRKGVLDYPPNVSAFFSTSELVDDA